MLLLLLLVLVWVPLLVKAIRSLARRSRAGRAAQWAGALAALERVYETPPVAVPEPASTVVPLRPATGEAPPGSAASAA